MIRRALVLDGALAVLISALAWYLRWPGLGASTLSFTDSWVGIIAHLDSSADVARVGLAAPGFTLLAKAWFLGVGFSTTAAQVPAFVAGVAVPGLSYLVARRVGVARAAGMMAGILIAVSPIHVDHSVVLKQYTLDALMSLGLIWLAWRAIDDQEAETTRRTVAVVLAAVAATLVSALVAPVAVSAVAAAALATWRSGRRTAALTAVFSYLAIGGAWGLVLSRLLPNELDDFWVGRYLTGWDDLPRIVEAFGSGLGLGSGPLLVAVVLAGVFGALTMIRRNQAAALLFIGPVLAAAALAAVQQVPLGTGRTDIYLYPVLVIFAAWVVQRALPSSLGQFVLVIPLLVAAAWPLPSVRYPAEQSRVLVDIILNERQSDEQILANYGSMYTLAVYGPWVDGLITGVPTVRGFVPSFNDPNIVALERVDEPAIFETLVREAATSDRVWVVFNPRTQPWTGEAIASGLSSKNYQLTESWRNGPAVLQYWSQ